MTFNATMGPLIVAVIQMGTDILNFILLMAFFIFGFAFSFRQALLAVPDENKEGMYVYQPPLLGLLGLFIKN